MRRSPSETWMFSVVFWNSVQLTSLSRRLTGKLFQIRGPAAAKHLSPKRLWTRVTEHFLPEENLRERAELSEARWIVGQIARYFAWQHLVYQAGNLEFNSSSDRQPMKLTQYRCDVFATLYELFLSLLRTQLQLHFQRSLCNTLTRDVYFNDVLHNWTANKCERNKVGE